MIPRGCKRFAETDFPSTAVSYHAAREKAVRPDHPSAMRRWWSPPPASGRAVLPALLWPNPCDAHCPIAFKEAAWVLLPYRIRTAAHAPDPGILRAHCPGWVFPSCDCIEAILRDQRRELQRSTSQLSLAPLPLIHQASGYVRYRAKTACLGFPASGFSGFLLRHRVLDRRTAQVFEAPHRVLRHDTRPVI